MGVPLITILQILFAFSALPANVTPGDIAFLRIDYPSAIAAYEQQLPFHPNDPELLWRLARAYVCAGEVKEDGEGELDFVKAEKYGRLCIVNDAANAEGHTWLAAALGYRALHAGFREKVRLTIEMCEEIEKALALNPANDAAYSMRGSYFRALANTSWLERRLASLLFGPLPEGGFDEAEKAFKKAIELAPDVMRHHYELGILYRDWGRMKEAHEVLERAATLPIRVAIDIPRLEKIKEILDSLTREERH